MMLSTSGFGVAPSQFFQESSDGAGNDSRFFQENHMRTTINLDQPGIGQTLS
jgi:hypothetical protein